MAGGYSGCPTTRDLLNRIRENRCFLSNRYPLYSTRNAAPNANLSKAGIFFLQNDFPPPAQEIACIIHSYGDGLYREEIFFFQRKEKNPDSWKEIVRFPLSNSLMPWGSPFGGARARLRLGELTPDSIIIPVESVRDGKPYGASCSVSGWKTAFIKHAPS